jgi:heat-inducible transcriptional repressor
VVEAELSPRQREILHRVVEEFISTGQPVGSKNLVARAGMTVSPSTVRNELAELESLGLLTHPHTSAGRVPTEDGYRFYAAELLSRLDARPATFPLDLSAVRSQVDSALEATTEMLSQLTRLAALVSAPPLESSTVRHVEVLLLQPEVVMVVAITSTGGVTKRVVAFDEPIDPGLVDWAAEYLNERVAGLQLGSSRLRKAFSERDLTPRERAFLDTLRPAFVELLRAEQRLYVSGTAGILDDVRAEELAAHRRLLEVLEQRAALLRILGEATARGPFVRVGGDLEPDLSGVVLVGAAYGVAHRTLGAVSLLGPLRMDYEKALRTVRSAAQELSRFVEEVYADS